MSNHPIFTLTGGLVSGHTAKHVVAALAAYWVVRYLQRRRILTQQGEGDVKGKQA